jgi:hypothetical protein
MGDAAAGVVHQQVERIFGLHILVHVARGAAIGAVSGLGIDGGACRRGFIPQRLGAVHPQVGRLSIVRIGMLGVVIGEARSRRRIGADGHAARIVAGEVVDSDARQVFVRMDHAVERHLQVERALQAADAIIGDGRVVDLVRPFDRDDAAGHRRVHLIDQSEARLQAGRGRGVEAEGEMDARLGDRDEAGYRRGSRIAVADPVPDLIDTQILEVGDDVRDIGVAAVRVGDMRIDPERGDE